MTIRERLLGAGLRKLIEDRCDFGAESARDPEALRPEVFLHAAGARRQASMARQAILREHAAFTLRADTRWGKERAPRTFQTEVQRRPAPPAALSVASAR